MMIVFIIGTLFGLILGMVLNHAIEESERKKVEVEHLRRIISQLQGGNENGKYN